MTEALQEVGCSPPKERVRNEICKLIRARCLRKLRSRWKKSDVHSLTSRLHGWLLSVIQKVKKIVRKEGGGGIESLRGENLKPKRQTGSFAQDRSRGSRRGRTKDE